MTTVGPVRVGVTGKTGAGKTTVTALVARAAAAAGRRVLAVDTDDSPNLGLSLGLSFDEVAGAMTVPRALVTGRAGGGVTASDLLANYGRGAAGGVTVLHALPMGEEQAGCGCAAHAATGSILGEALGRFDLAVLDLEGGLDHLERPSGTVAHVDALVVVLEASRKSALSAGRTVDQARAHGIGRVLAVANKARAGEPGDEAAFAAFAAHHDVPMAAVLGWSDDVFAADRAGRGLPWPPGALAGPVAVLLEALGPGRAG